MSLSAFFSAQLNGFTYFYLIRIIWFTINHFDAFTPKGTNYTATCLPSWKLSKLDEPDMQDTDGEAGTSS